MARRSRRHFELAASHGLTNLEAADLRALDVRFLDFDRKDADDHIFLENPQQVLRLPDEQQRSAGLLDLNYYLPCRVANREGGGTRTVAILGLGRTDDGDFLSSEDMEVLGSLAGYIGIAIQNAQLYRRLEQKIGEFERLKEFHENIVESIHIGIFAVDLEDRIESWNAQMEVMYAKSRGEALRQPLAAIFPPEFMARFDSVRGEQGTHTFYKVRLAAADGRDAGGEHCDCAAADARFRGGGTDCAGGRHHRPHRAGGAADAGGEAVVDRAAGGGRGA